MKKNWQVAFALVVSALIIAGLWYAARVIKQTKAEIEMDCRELWYDADGGFIMIDRAAGHMGIYRATKPLKHVWRERLQHIKPGHYTLDICDGWIELYNNEMLGSYVIWQSEKESRFFLHEVEQGIPVYVY